MNDDEISIPVDKKIHSYIGIFLSIIIILTLAISLMYGASDFPVIAFCVSLVSAAFFLSSSFLVKEIKITQREIFFKPIGINFDLSSIIGIEKVARHHGKAYAVIVKTNSERPIWIPSTFTHGKGIGRFDLRGGNGELFLEILQGKLSERQNKIEPWR